MACLRLSTTGPTRIETFIFVSWENVSWFFVIDRNDSFERGLDLEFVVVGKLRPKGTADLAKLNLEFCQVRAPIDGRISRALVTEGNLISGGVSGTTLLPTIVSLDPLYLYGDADERAILKYNRLAREGARVSARDEKIPAEMELGDEPGFPHRSCGRSCPAAPSTDSDDQFRFHSGSRSVGSGERSGSRDAAGAWNRSLFRNARCDLLWLTPYPGVLCGHSPPHGAEDPAERRVPTPVPEADATPLTS